MATLSWPASIIFWNFSASCLNSAARASAAACALRSSSRRAFASSRAFASVPFSASIASTFLPSRVELPPELLVDGRLLVEVGLEVLLVGREGAELVGLGLDLRLDVVELLVKLGERGLIGLLAIEARGQGSVGRRAIGDGGVVLVLGNACEGGSGQTQQQDMSFHALSNTGKDAGMHATPGPRRGALPSADITEERTAATVVARTVEHLPSATS